MTTINGIPRNREQLQEYLHHVRPHALPFFFMIALMMGLYFASVAIAPGWITWGVGAIALLIIAITALARLNDIVPEQTSKRWQIRRAGLMLVGASSVSLAIGDPLIMLLGGVEMTDFPSWKEVSLRWGISLTWITTPHMPPWWRYITGEYKTIREAKVAAASVSISGLYPTGQHQAYVSPELSTAIDAVRELKNVIDALPPDEGDPENPRRIYEPREIERRRGGDRRETDL